jgi:hypothetical protein
MALSDYERRVLREIESDLGRSGYSRWFLLRSAARQLWLPLVCTVLAVVGCVIAARLLVLTAAVGTAAAASFALGLTWGLNWHPHRWRPPHPR